MPESTKKIKLKILAIILAALVVGGLGGFGTYYFIQYRRVVKHPEIVANQEVKDIVSAVGKHMELPNDETPTLATVQDKDKLKDQAFFANSENGDKILIYTKAKKAIVYRQKTDKVINVGPILLQNDQQGATPATNSSPSTTNTQR